MLGLTDVWFRYGGKAPWVLAGADVSIGVGRLTALTGPSGSGKSTALRLLDGRLRPQRGSVLVTGETAGWIHQTSLALWSRTAVDNVGLPLVAAGAPRAAAGDTARQIMAGYGIADLGDRPARTLSGGQLQRLAVARAEATGASTLFCDEPTGQLDRANSELVGASLRTLADRGITVVVATHDPALVALADEVHALVDGRFD